MTACQMPLCLRPTYIFLASFPRVSPSSLPFLSSSCPVLPPLCLVPGIIVRGFWLCLVFRWLLTPVFRLYCNARY